MATLEDPNLAYLARIESNGGLRTVVVPRGDGYVYSATSGTLAAALASGSAVFLMRSPASAAKLAYIDRIRLQWTTIVAFTTPITAGRRLQIHRGSGSTATSGGTAPAANGVLKKNTNTTSNSIFDSSLSGDIRIASTGALTITGGSLETEAIATMSLVHAGAAGAFVEEVFEFGVSESSELILNPNQYLAVRTPVAMDAAGTWQLAVKVDWREAVST